MEHKWLLENFNYAKNLIDEKNLPNCLIITGNKAIGKKDLAEEISKYYLQDDLNLTIEFDKSLPLEYLNHKSIKDINSQIWGQGFPAPVFFGIFDVVKQEIIANNHNKCVLKNDYGKYDAIFFNFSRVLADRIEIIYTIEINNFNQNSSIQLIIKSENERK